MDGELDTDIPGSALREIILDHVAHCSRCERLERQLRAMRHRLRQYGIYMAQLADEQATPEFRARMKCLLAG